MAKSEAHIYHYIIENTANKLGLTTHESLVRRAVNYVNFLAQENSQRESWDWRQEDKFKTFATQFPKRVVQQVILNANIQNNPKLCILGLDTIAHTLRDSTLNMFDKLTNILADPNLQLLTLKQIQKHPKLHYNAIWFAIHPYLDKPFVDEKIFMLYQHQVIESPDALHHFPELPIAIAHDVKHVYRCYNPDIAVAHHNMYKEAGLVGEGFNQYLSDLLLIFIIEGRYRDKDIPLFQQAGLIDPDIFFDTETRRLYKSGDFYSPDINQE